MRKTIVLCTLVALVAAACTTEELPDRARPQARVAVLGIDGGTWDVIVPMMEAGELPHLKSLYTRGVRGVLESRPPVVSPVVWTTMFTGRPHAEHGVENWKTSQSQHRKVQALWEITDDHDYRAAIFNVPGSWPPDEIEGVMVSGFPLPGSTFAGNTGHVVTTAELSEPKTVPTAYREGLDRVKAVIGGLEVGEWSAWFDVPVLRRPTWSASTRAKRLADDKFYLAPVYRTDEGLVVMYPPHVREHIAENITAPYIPEGPGWSKHGEPDTPDYLYEHLNQVFRGQTDAAKLWTAEDWDLYIYVMTFVDRVSHPYWAYANPDDYDKNFDRERAKRYASAVADSYRETDRHLGELLERLDDDVYIVIGSDHGFQSSRDKSKYIGTHHYDGIYLVAGPGIAAADGERAYIEDIGPTVLYLMGMPVAEDMAGSVLGGLTDTLGRAPETIATYENVARPSTEDPVDAETWEQLKGLGYVDGDAPTPKAKPKSEAKPGAKPGAKPNAKPNAKPQAAPNAAPAAGDKPAASGPPTDEAARQAVIDRLDELRAAKGNAAADDHADHDH